MSVKTLQAKLDSFRDLEEDWDSHGGSPPSEKSIEFGKAVLEGVGLLVGVSIPWVVPSAGGGVYITWEAGKRAIDIEVDDESVVCTTSEDALDENKLKREYEDAEFSVERAVAAVHEFFTRCR